MHTFVIIPAFLSFILCTQAVHYRPVVLWHGMGDDCCNPDSMGKVQESIKSTLPGVYVYSVQLASTEGEDRRVGFFGNVNDQVAKVCDILKSDENLRDGYNAIGFSQGGQFLRAVLQRCNWPRMYNLITFGSQHAGVSDIPGCLSNDSTCQLMRSIVHRGVYTGWVQRSVVHAQYYKDFNNYDTYLEKSIFLPDLNNERPLPNKNPDYAHNLASLNKLVLIRFTEDDTVKPRETAWFWFYDEDGELVDVHDQPLYREDWIGLRRLEESGGVVYQDCVGQHMRFSLEYLEDYVVKPYLSLPLPLSPRPQILVDDEGDLSSAFLPLPFNFNRSTPHHHLEVMVDEDGDWMVSDGINDFDRDASDSALVDVTLGDGYAHGTTVDDEGDWIIGDGLSLEDLFADEHPAVPKEYVEVNFDVVSEELFEEDGNIWEEENSDCAEESDDEAQEEDKKRRDDQDDEEKENENEVENSKFGQVMFGKPRLSERASPRRSN